MFQQLFWHSWFRVHWKHCSSNHNTSRDLEVQKTCIKIGNLRCYKCNEKAIWGGQIIVLWIPLTQVQMLKSFNSLLIKFNVSTQETSCQNFFSSRLYVREFFLDNSLVQEIFSYPYALAGYFFQNHPTPPPPPSEVKWLARVFVLRWIGVFLEVAMTTTRIILGHLWYTL